MRTSTALDNLLDYIKANPGSSNQDIADCTRQGYGGIKNNTGRLFKQQKIEYVVKQNARSWYFIDDYIKLYGYKPENLSHLMKPSCIYDIIDKQPGISFADMLKVANISSYRLEKLLEVLVTNGTIALVKKSKRLYSYYTADADTTGKIELGPKSIFNQSAVAKHFYNMLDTNRLKYPELKFNKKQYMY